jgi:hypothetical protein
VQKGSTRAIARSRARESTLAARVTAREALAITRVWRAKPVVHVVERTHEHRAVRAETRARYTIRVTTRAIIGTEHVLACARARSLCVEMLDLAT